MYLNFPGKATKEELFGLVSSTRTKRPSEINEHLNNGKKEVEDERERDDKTRGRGEGGEITKERRPEKLEKKEGVRRRARMRVAYRGCWH